MLYILRQTRITSFFYFFQKIYPKLTIGRSYVDKGTNKIKDWSVHVPLNLFQGLFHTLMEHGRIYAPVELAELFGDQRFSGKMLTYGTAPSEAERLALFEASLANLSI